MISSTVCSILKLKCVSLGNKKIKIIKKMIIKKKTKQCIYLNTTEQWEMTLTTFLEEARASIVLLEHQTAGRY